MKYDITKSHSPKMPVLGKGTERTQILLKQASKDMYAPVVPMLFPVLGAHISGTEFQYPDLSWKEPCGMMANKEKPNRPEAALYFPPAETSSRQPSKSP